MAESEVKPSSPAPAVKPSSSKQKTKDSYLVLSLIALYTAYVVYSSLIDDGLPEVPEQYWGNAPAAPNNEDVSVKPFKIIVVEDKQLKTKLAEELASNVFLGATGGGGGDAKESQGAIDTAFVRNVANHWKDSYKWTDRVKLLNKYPHFVTRINGLQIHFQRIRSSDVFPAGSQRNATGKNPRVILMLHGWAQSFTEFQKLIPLLMENDKVEYPFELVIPSLPGFGYSEGSSKPGLGCVAISQILLKLMQRLGHEIFLVHGSSDWGSTIATTMATLYPENVNGLHLHQCQSKHPKTLFKHLSSAAFSYFVMSSDESLRATGFYLESTGSTAAQFARPETISMALANSPSGLLSYILEMNSARFNGQVMNIDDVLDNVMVYWSTKSIVSAARIFTNQMNQAEQAYNLDSFQTFVPTSCTFYPSNSIVPQQSEFLLSDKYAHIIRYNEEAQQSPITVANNMIESFELIETKELSEFDRRHTCRRPGM